MNQIREKLSGSQDAQQDHATPLAYDAFRATLADRGWAILQAEDIGNDPVAILNQIGRIVPQYNGQDTFEVTYQKGFDDVPYSQSMNGIGPHTEAPAYDPPPRYLALFCHRQARCGHGETLLADGIDFFDNALSSELRDWAFTNPVNFLAAAKPGSEEVGQKLSHLRETHSNEPMLRFSFNLFRYGNVNPSGEEMARATEQDSGALSRIATEGEAYFVKNMIPVLIPDGCMLVWNNHRLMHGRGQFADPKRHLTRYWLS
jgi:alpha-ketoglutarate-dependent taurine dioxygenase